MKQTKTQKKEASKELAVELKDASCIYFTNYQGLKFAELYQLRSKLKPLGGRYQVVKNTLLGRAVEGTAMEGLERLFKGPTAIAYSFEDPAAPAKIATKVAKGEEKFVIKGGFVDGKALDVKGVEALSNLPGKDELRATFLATLLAVPQNFLRLTTAAQQNFALLLAARERALGEGGEAKQDEAK